MDVLVGQQGGDLVVWPVDRVALLREEAHGRLEATSADGDVMHLPGPLPAPGPRVEVQKSVQVHPRWVGADGELPGGWRLDLPDLPPPPPEPEDPEVRGLGVRVSEVLYLEGREGKDWWVTTRGDRPDPGGGTRTHKARRHPAMVRVGYRYVNLHRIRRIRPQGDGFRVLLDQGSDLPLGGNATAPLCQALGLPHLRGFAEDGPAQGLYQEGLRDWPVELMTASGDWLRAQFGDDVRRLVANLIWQAFRCPSATYGKGHRDFWYRPVWPALVRAGFDDDRHEQILLDLLEKMVGDWRILTFRDLGFEDPRPDARRLGARRPGVLLAAEKHSLRREWERVCAAFGCSGILLGGQPSLLAVEFLAAALLAAGTREVLLVAYVDFDPAGWSIARALAAQLERYGVAVTGIRFLVRPGRFEPWEREALSYPLHPRGPSGAGMLRKWLEESGGVDGLPRGLHADHLRPGDRVLRAFQEETGLVP